MSFLLMDLKGTSLTAKEAQLLQHKAVAGLILFQRNYENKQQLIELIQSIRNVKNHVLITVDHEGGRVQRFIKDFTKIPPMRQILKSAQGQQPLAEQWAQDIGWLMASELLEVGIDMTFAPVLDRDGISDVIGHRAFSEHVTEITYVARSLIQGFQEAGMASCGKHFPGHGSVKADTHVAAAIDTRALEEIERLDMLPFTQLIKENQLDAMMPAHVIYSAVDQMPAGFSEIWLQKLLRQKYQFDGVIFSDDLSMEAAHAGGDYNTRIEKALKAGCDIVLLCNNSEDLEKVLHQYDWPEPSSIPKAHQLLSSSLFKPVTDTERYEKTKSICAQLQQAFEES